MDCGLAQFVMQAKPLNIGVHQRIRRDHQFQYMSLKDAMYGFIEVTGEKWRPKFCVNGQKYEIGVLGESRHQREKIYDDIKQLPDMTVDVIHYVGPLGKRCNLVCYNQDWVFNLIKFFFFFLVCHSNGIGSCFRI